MKKKSTKRALLSSLLSLVLCLSMLIGTTFAWFTDSVTSSNNIIKAGNLDVTMEWLEGEDDPTDANAAWIDASTGAIFDYDLWEPGYTCVRHIKIENAGSLALKYQVAIQATGEVSKLADVIDVYYIDPATGPVSDRATFDEGNKLGTLTEVLAGMETSAMGNLLAGEKDVITLALKMQESAGNEYQNLAIGSHFAVILFATQYTYEEDSFGDDYDVDAPKMYSVNGVKYDTVDEALAVAQDGDKVVLSVVDQPLVIEKAIDLTLGSAQIVAADGENAIEITADTTLTVEGMNRLVGGKNADGIKVADGVALTIKGTGFLAAYGNACTEYESVGNYTNKPEATAFAETGGNGIEGTNITVDGLENLIAEGYGKDAAGIGKTGATVTINDTKIVSARGGFQNVTGKYNDAKYTKSEPEGGAAIGGANITITDSHIVKAIGGSKAAGIGARFWQPTNITITDTVIDHVVGGTSAAGIGGSRIAKDVTAQDVYITIVDSTITAVGGYYGAGIGSGYDTHCTTVDEAPMHTIYIKGNSVINATGGKYAAGIGTGYHVAKLAGEIETTVTINAVSGTKFYKASYTQAQDIGFGVVDPAREAKDNTSTFKYNGVENGIPSI